MANYHNKPIEDIASEFGTDANRGLRQDEIQSRIGKYGKNTLVQKKQRSFISMFVAQFKSFLIILLIIAAVISGVMGVKTGEGLLDTYIIAGILLLNAFIGAYQEFKAQKSLESLKKMAAPVAKVVRDGEPMVVNVEDVVPGDLVELEVGQTYWRSNSINQNGANHYNQVNSVYFAIPEEAVVKYGELWGVTCRWDERRTSPILVTNDGELEATFKKWIGQKTGITDRFAVYDTYSGSIGGGMPASDWGWGYGYSVNENTGEVNDVGGVAITIDDTPPGWVFRSNESTVLNTRISSADMLAWASSHGFANYLFTSDVDEGRTYGEQEHTFYADEPFDLLTFNATASGWDKFLLGWQQFWSFGKPDYDWGIGNATVDPIKRVTDADFSGTEEINADNLLVHDLDYGTFKAYYDAHKEDAVYLLRFAVTDYYAAQATVVTDAEWWNPGSWGSGTLDTTSTYMARETVFLDFEIIELTFNKDGNLTVLPVVMSPIDIISGIDPPAYAGFDWTLVWWLVGIALGTVVVGVVGGILESAAKK